MNSPYYQKLIDMAVHLEDIDSGSGEALASVCALIRALE